MIHVIAEITVRDGCREEFLAEFHRLVPIVRDEDGCLEYGPAVDLASDLSAEPRPTVVTVIEKWVDEPALRAHLKAAHMDDYRQRAGHLIAGVSIRVYAPA
jgi:quinol monooxygenase YgiN